MINLVAWNVRSLNKRDCQNAVRELIVEFKLELIGLVETRENAQNVLTVQQCINTKWSWFVDYVNGPGNRIWIGWNNQEVDVHIIEAHQ